ncbi:phospholipase D family protein [Nesterenkonia sp. DZ6]|uniref:phospholipase D family protein n=1 Tax=Nesterenkonia sp. DZ6 TaxID=2901229 RepID=UPI001F4C9F9D|nr:phospholipase D family protein [Nesterenkonia sp. DZ6]MCH8559680.1 phospholipase D family protein [Nesterenkonia sp. DZ6]
MTLNPQNRILLQDSLQPPPGYRVDLAIGTTYSLDLVSLLAASLSFASPDAAEVSGEHSDPVQLLEAVQRCAEKMLIFTQAGGIYVPSKYRSVLTFIEDSIHEVVAPNPDGIFHPKIWALRFADDDGALRHRLIVLSRNITQDQAWDTALVLDEMPDSGAEDQPSMDAAPASDFLRRLPRLATRDLDPGRARQVEDLAATFSRVRLMLPEPFTDGELLSIGLDGSETWPFAGTKARRILAISPFLSPKAVTALKEVTPGVSSDKRLLLSSPVALDMLGAEAAKGWQLRVLPTTPTADHEVEESENGRSHLDLETASGLHAKTVVVDLPERRSLTVTGSANLTGRPSWGRSVEFNALLFGNTRECGVEAMLGTSVGKPGLEDVWEPYTPAAEETAAQQEYEAERKIELWHIELASARPILAVRTTGEATVEATLSLELPAGEIGVTTVWPISLPQHARLLGPQVQWSRLSALNVTPFLAVETTLGSGETRVTRRRVIFAELAGDIDGRKHDAFREIIKDRSDVLRYLMLLLNEASYADLLAQMDLVDSSGTALAAGDQGRIYEDFALFEPLVRAIGRDPETLVRVGNLMEQLRDSPDAEDLVPAGLEELWSTVWAVHAEVS